MLRPWKCHGDVFQVASCNQLWREKAQRTIQLYVDRTNGSSVEFRKSAVLFRYAKSDSEFGAIQAAELKQHLEQLFEVCTDNRFRTLSVALLNRNGR